MPQGFAVENATSVEVVAAWVVPTRTFRSSDSWVVLGEYYLPKSCQARLDVVACVSEVGLVCEVRLWDTSANAPLDGEVTVNALAPTRKLGATVGLIGGRSYQVQARVYGMPEHDWRFGAVLSATITDP
jgi:hypothetical protein